ncbi:hypothetical protein QTO34_003490 [Cnephaeus nilssonii]|uniref:Tetratricopeptide repeat domain 17 n=1 Tax=Cnephaeus nilssonii TaxID=3371016 RepID=A0AA40HRX3_CNENI|nr:hypothetical protein QTO34_003490 [Eptesicus nilssonii]
MAAAVRVRGRCELPPRSGPGWLLSLSALLSMAARGAFATTHWVVTEDGKIQQQVDSPMNLKHPHDLVILMRQETTVNYLKELEKQLVAQKIHIEENEDRDTGLEQRHNKEDPDCIKAKVPLGDLDLYDGTYITLESKDISPEDYIDTESPVPPDPEQPDCTKILELPYSIHAFQHLRGVQERVNLSAPLLPKEDPIFTYLSKRLGRNIDDIGHLIHEGLQKNSSSWVLYNMASFYWRIKNEPYQVVECAMRALHFSSRHNKDIALVNLANVLHRAHFSADAAVVVHAALDDSDFFTSYYTLGNIYAMLGEYNHSVLCYDHALQARPGFEQALKRKHAVLCQQKLEQKLEAQHRSLQRTLNELKEYQKQHDHYLRQQEILEKHKLIQEEQILRNIIHETQMAKEAQLGNHQICRLVNQQHTLHCQWDQPVRYHRGDIFENVDYVQFGEDSSTSSMMSVNFDVQTNQSDVSNLVKSPPVAHSVLWIWGRDSDAYRDKQNILWPKRADCAESYPRVPVSGELPTYFLPPENKGLRQDELKNSLYPPEFCYVVFFNSLNHLNKYILLSIEILFKCLSCYIQLSHSSFCCFQILLSRINNYTIPEEEIGSFLFHAINKPNAPVWLILNEAGLYWRAVGNSTFAIACLQRALNLAPLQYQDIPLVNLANLLIHYGLHLDAAKLLLQALAINSSEPLTFLSLGNAYLALKNISGALEAFRQALKLTTKCPECESSLKLIRCMQFYPFLYNITSSICSGKQLLSAGKIMNLKQSFFFHPLSLKAHTQHSNLGTSAWPVPSFVVSNMDFPNIYLRSYVAAERFFHQFMFHSDRCEMSKELLFLLRLFLDTLILCLVGIALHIKHRKVRLYAIELCSKNLVEYVASDNCFPKFHSLCTEEDPKISFIIYRNRQLKIKPKSCSLSPWCVSQLPSASRYSQNLDKRGKKIKMRFIQVKNQMVQSLPWHCPDWFLFLFWVDYTLTQNTHLFILSIWISPTSHVVQKTFSIQPLDQPSRLVFLKASIHRFDHWGGGSNYETDWKTRETGSTRAVQNHIKGLHPKVSALEIKARDAANLESKLTAIVTVSRELLAWSALGAGYVIYDRLFQSEIHSPKNRKDISVLSVTCILHVAGKFNIAKDVRVQSVETDCHCLVTTFRIVYIFVMCQEGCYILRWAAKTEEFKPHFHPSKDRHCDLQVFLIYKKAEISL